MGSLPQTTFLGAIRKHPQHVATFPGLTYDLIRKHLPPLTVTLKGNMIHQQQGLGSTGNKKQEVENTRKSVTDMTPTRRFCTANEDKIFCFAAIGDKNENTIYSELTG